MATAVEQAPSIIRGRPAGFLRDMLSIAARALRLIPRDPEGVVPPLVMGVFFYTINIGSLQDFAESIPGMDYKAFQLPVAMIFAITGVSRAITLVTDIQSGYFDRLMMTPVRRMPLLVGLMVADFLLVVALTIPVLLLGSILGVQFASGMLGVLVLVLIAGFWGLAFTGFPYAIALKTGNPAAVNSSFLLFLPFIFLTSVFVPREVMTGWMATIAVFNPVTYVLEAMRSLIFGGWEWPELVRGALATVAVGVVSMTLAWAALRGRARRK